jgi:multidrug transporter EmrE-like cation transporter
LANGEEKRLKPIYLMDDKPKINLAGYLSFTVTMIMNLLFTFTQLGAQILPKGEDWLIIFPMMLVAIISGINGINNALKNGMKGMAFSILGVVGVAVILIVRFLKFCEMVNSINS